MASLLPFLGLLAAPKVESSPGAIVERRSGSEFAQVRQIFRAQCLSCHTAKDPMGGLNLESIAGIQKGGVSGKMIVPGDPDKSILLRRIKGLDGLPMMPMGFKPLTAEQTQLISDWIRNGANYEAKESKHWAYVSPVRPKVPAMPAWGRNPIDAFIGQKLARNGLTISPIASRETLIRRLSLDLIGLPPTPEEIDDFLRDQAPGAYERVVDRLMASPHYGERQAHVWLDLSRFADSDGFEKDLARSNYLYRDWLISAFNRNLPYDRFTIDQLAGDLVPKGDLSNVIATGFHRNTMFNREGGVDKDEGMYEVILDRVGTTGTVWMGSTIACAQCHDHKYDPISQKEFFSLYAFFANNQYEPRGDDSVSEQKYFEPTIKVFPSETRAKMRALEEAIKTSEQALEQALATPDVQAERARWDEAGSPDWSVPQGVEITAEGATLEAQPDGSYLSVGPTPDKATYLVRIPTSTSFSAIRLEALADPSLPQKGPGRSSGGNFVLSRITGLPVRVARATFEQNGFPVRGALDEDPNSGWAVHGGAGRDQSAVFVLERPISGAEMRLEFQSGYGQHVLGRFRISTTSAEFPLKGFAPASGPSQNPDQEFRMQSNLLSESQRRLSQQKTELDSARRSAPEAMVIQERPIKGPLMAKLRDKGSFVGDGPMVPADTPAILPPLFNGSSTQPATRLDLARWLVRKDHPLTARVQVNRIWQTIFGRGIVETTEDFGTQGAKPDHPELLDWLAVEFMDRGWDMKAMVRLIVTSTVYRQSSVARAELVAKDPENVLLARGPRFRLDAELIRDAALSASGLLSRKVGGPSVYPPQPEGVWDTPFNSEPYRVSDGEDKYRRGMYTVVKRTAAYPSFLAFDATSREVCTTRRSRTNTPLQALVMLNDPVYLEAAARLGERIDSANPDVGLAEAFRRATSRRPTAEEHASLVRRFRELVAQYRAKPELAAKLGGSPERAASTMISSVILNLDETISRP